MRLAVKVAYDGTRFSGSQVQPGVRTVHGEVARALADLGAPDARLLWAGRTDAGVSAAGNVVAFESPLPPETLLPALTFRMEDAWAWAAADVGEAFEPRHARERRYRYHLGRGVDPAALREALDVFVGTHDFTAFARVEPGVNPTRTVRAVEVREATAGLVVDVVGDSFLWNQVRRMVEAARRVAAGEVARADVAQALADARPADFGTAPPEPLVLVDVRYDGVTFRPPPHDVAARIRARLAERHEARVREAAVLATMLDAASR